MFKSIFSFFRSNITIFLLNTIGMTVAFATVIIIAIHVKTEFSYDKFHKDSDRLYRFEIGNTKGSNVIMSQPIADIIATNFTQHIEQAVYEDFWEQTNGIASVRTEQGDLKSYKIEKACFSPNFFDEYLNFEIINGDIKSINDYDKIIINSSLAERIFPNGNPIGQSIEISAGNSKKSYIVGAVYKDFPENTIFRNVIYHRFDEKPNYGKWNNNATKLYIKLNAQSNSTEVEKIIEDHIHKEYGGDGGFRVYLTKLSDIYFKRDSGSDTTIKGNEIVTKALVIVAIMVLLISLINFINFYFSVASIRTKSIAIRRIMGESIAHAKLSILIECIVLFIICFGLAIASILMLNDLNFIEISLSENILMILLILFAIVIIGGVIGKVYSRYLVAENTSFSLLYTKIKRKSTLARMLIVFQFFISFVLIVVSIYMIFQMKFIDNKDVGYDKDNIITFDISIDIAKKYEILRAELQKIPDVKDIAFSADKFATLDYYGSLGREYKDENINFDIIQVSPNFLDVMGIKIIDGRNFTPNDYKNASGNNTITYIFNEVADLKYDLESGELVGGAYLAGVCENYNVMSLRRKIKPTAFMLSEQEKEWSPLTNVYCKVSSDDITEIISKIKVVISGFDPSLPIDFSLFSNDLKSAYKKESSTTFNMILFSIISIIISLMGVVGQLIYEVKSRIKEIAIRKVYGSTEKEIFQLFNRGLIKISLIGFVLSIPFSYFIVMIWRRQFEYTIDLSIYIYVVSFISVIALISVVVIAICWKYSKQNPVKILNK